MPNAQDASEILALRLYRPLRHFPKADARKVALLGLRFTESSAENRVVEARLNLACAVALQNSGDAVVFEKWRLEDSLFENTLRPEAVGSVWNSATTVQGTISRESGKLVVKLVVENPGGGPARIESVEGSAANLRALGESLASAIVQMPLPGAAEAKSEAAAYLKEAIWLLSRRMYQEAVQAVESALVLDPGNREAEVLRIKTYALNAYPDDLARRRFQPVQGYGGAIEKEQIGRAVAMAGEMSRLVGEYIVKYPAEGKDTLEDPVSLGIRTLLTSLYRLMAAYDLDYHLEDPAGVEALRAATERNGKLLQASPNRAFRGSEDFYLTYYLGYWCATPEATVAEYRKALGRNFVPRPNAWLISLRIPLSLTSGRNPPLLDVGSGDRQRMRPKHVVCRMVAWKPEDEKRLATLWQSFLQELEASDDLLAQADALFLRWNSMEQEANGEETLAKIVDFLERNADCLVGPDARALGPMLAAPLEHLDLVKDVSLSVRYLDVLTKLFEQERQLPFELVERIPRAFGFRRQGDIPVERLEALRDAMTRHLARWGGDKDSYYRGVVAASLRPFEAIVAQAKGRKPALPAVGVSRLWRSSEYLKGRGEFDGSSGTWHEGWLWFAQRKPVGFWRINPETFESEFISGPGAPESIRALNGDCRPFFVDDQIFVAGDRDVWIFDLRTRTWSAMGMPVARYVLYKANGELWAACGEQPDFLAPDLNGPSTGLYRIDSKNRKADLIFNTKRRPAAHPLDYSPPSAPMGVFSGTSGQLIVGLNTGNKKFLLVEDASPWEVVRPNSVDERICNADEALLIQRSNTLRNGKWARLLESIVSVDSRGEMELLLVDPLVAKASRLPAKTEPVWMAPESLNDHFPVGDRLQAVALEGGRLFVLTTDLLGSSENSPTTLELTVFRRGEAEAVRFPLRFEIPAGTGPPPAREGTRENRILNPRGLWHSFLAGPKGLVLSGEWGFWFIPMSEVDRAVSERSKKEPSEG